MPYSVGILNPGVEDTGFLFNIGFGKRWGKIQLGVDASWSPINTSVYQGNPEPQGPGSIFKLNSRLQFLLEASPSSVNPYLSMMEVGVFKSINSEIFADSSGLTLAPAGLGLILNAGDNLEADLNGRMRIYFQTEGDNLALVGSELHLGMTHRF